MKYSNKESKLEDKMPGDSLENELMPTVKKKFKKRRKGKLNVELMK